MVWLVDEAIRSIGLPGDVGHSDKLLLHTKTPRYTQYTHQEEAIAHTLLACSDITYGKFFFPGMGRLFVKSESFWISLTLTSNQRGAYDLLDITKILRHPKKIRQPML